MAKISTFPLDTTVSKTDKVIGTDSVTGATKNFNLGAVLSLVSGTVNVPGQDEIDSFEFDQSSASSTWTITHNLDKFPSITIVDTNNNVVNGEAQYQSKNTIVLNFSAAFAGKAYLN
jgi:hypothetical protein